MKDIIKTWFYKDGLDKNPIPVLIFNRLIFNEFCVVSYREIDENGIFSFPKDIVIYNADKWPFGMNEYGKFPEIKTKYCKNCGFIEEE